MWLALQRFLGTQIAKIGALSIKGVHLIIVGTVLAAGVGVGAGVYIARNHNNDANQARTVVVTINGVNTGLDSNCHYTGGAFDAIDQALTQAGFTDLYQSGCPFTSAALGGGGGSRLDIAEYSYADSPGQMVNGHWKPNSFTACAPNTNSLETDSQHLATLLDAYSSVYPDAHFELVGHSLGGLVALQGAADYEDAHGRAQITKVITLDSPLHGRSAGNSFTQAFGAAVVTAGLNGLGGCPANVNSSLGQTLNAMAQEHGNLAENEMAILAAHGVEVYTLGNLDDCLYQSAICPDAFEHAVKDLATKQHGKIFGILAGVLAEGAVLLTISNEVGSQFIGGAFQEKYHLGQQGSWPGGHGAILGDSHSVADIARLLTNAPSAAIFAVNSPHALPLLHVFVTGPDTGIQMVTVQVAASDGKVVQQFSLNAAGVIEYTDTNLTLDPQKVGKGQFTATISAVTDGQNATHVPQTPGPQADAPLHDFVARVTFSVA